MPNSWVFQANPEVYLVDEALRTLEEHTWLVQQHRKEIHVDDKVYIWRGGLSPAMLARGIVLTEPEDMEPNPAENKFLIQPLKFNGKRCRVRIKTEKFPTPLTKMKLLKDPKLSEWSVLSGLQGTNFRMTPEIETAIERMLVMHKNAQA